MIDLIQREGGLAYRKEELNRTRILNKEREG